MPRISTIEQFPKKQIRYSAISKSSIREKEIAKLELAAIRPITAAGIYVHRRFHVSPVIADLAGSLAGLGPGLGASQ
jgi:hypothetical protein